MGFEMKAYYERIGLELSGNESETERLKQIHLHHITHIPFEAIEPYMHREVSVEPDQVFEKMVVHGRGGYCFEQNSLLCAALNAAGIKTFGVLTRISGPTGFGTHSHRMNIAEADGVRYIADVGYGGDCFVLPLEFKLDVVQSDGRNTYRVIKSDKPLVQYIIQIMRGGEFVDMMGFDDVAALESDFEFSNFYTNCSPKSGFRMLLMGARPTMEGGKYTLFNNRASVTSPDGTVEHLELNDEELRAFISDKLGVNMEGVEFKLKEMQV